jgi:hypothetical protein
MQRPVLACLCVAALAPACGGDTPTAPSGTGPGTITFREIAPPSGSSIVVSRGAPPGAFIDRGSGQLSITMDITRTRAADFGQLDVHLLSDDPPGSSCGSNLPDGPTWSPWTGRGITRITVSGFQIFRLPCDVIGIRAILHLGPRPLSLSSPLLVPSRILADGSTVLVHHLRR